MKLLDLLSGTRILEITHSKDNGEIKVVKDFTWGTYIKVNNLTQSGGILTKVWKETLKKVLQDKPEISNCLIIGLGGGSVANLVSQYWVGAKITGVDIDQKMVNLGKKYLSLDKINIDIKIQDASDFLTKSNSPKTTGYDLILVDLYCGDKFPEKFESSNFLIKIKKLLNKNGIVVFNRLVGPKYKEESLQFAKDLEKIFKKTDHFYPHANLMLICQ